MTKEITTSTDQQNKAIEKPNETAKASGRSAEKQHVLPSKDTPQAQTLEAQLSRVIKGWYQDGTLGAGNQPGNEGVAAAEDDAILKHLKSEMDRIVLPDGAKMKVDTVMVDDMPEVPEQIEHKDAIKKLADDYHESPSVSIVVDYEDNIDKLVQDLEKTDMDKAHANYALSQFSTIRENFSDIRDKSITDCEVSYKEISAALDNIRMLADTVDWPPLKERLDGFLDKAGI
jgi:hypothetical protein